MNVATIFFSFMWDVVQRSKIISEQNRAGNSKKYNAFFYTLQCFFFLLTTDFSILVMLSGVFCILQLRFPAPPNSPAERWCVQPRSINEPWHGQQTTNYTLGDALSIPEKRPPILVRWAQSRLYFLVRKVRGGCVTSRQERVKIAYFFFDLIVEIRMLINFHNWNWESFTFLCFRNQNSVENVDKMFQ